ncbi:MAG: hypothetical protein IT367_20960 [Candidatus Hydrogenedentes bacterium]|nr:hypothetical protein [Candidatus Hydrogenedentota bacterium]
MTKPVSAMTTWASQTSGNTSDLDSNFSKHQVALNDLNTYSNFTATDTGSANTYTPQYSSSLSGALTAGLRLQFLANATNTGASTCNATVGGSALGSKSILLLNGAALAPGDIVQNEIVDVIYDGTQYLLLSPRGSITRIVLGTEQATTSGTSKNFTGIPTWARRITVNFVGVSTNGTQDIILQIGPAGGVETSGYTSTCSSLTSAVTSTNGPSTGYLIVANVGAGSSLRGTVTLTCEDASDFTWCMTSIMAQGGGTDVAAGAKAAASAITQLTITMDGGTDTFDAGAINITYE